MELLDRALGLVELLAVPASLVWLLRGGLSARKLLVVIVVAGTVAQPFGMVVTAQNNPPPSSAKAVEPTGIHVARVAGIPILPFVVYRREDLLAGLGDNMPTATLRVRSWFWLPVLTNSTNVAGICSVGFATPCWDPPADVAATGERLSLRENGDGEWITNDNPDGESQPFIWGLAPGIASPLGLAYWAVAAAIIVRKRRSAPTGEPA